MTFFFFLSKYDTQICTWKHILHMSIINYQLLSIAIVNQHPFLLPNLIYDETFSSHPVRRLWDYRDVWRLPLNSNFSSLSMIPCIAPMVRSDFLSFSSLWKKNWQKSKWRTWNKCFFFHFSCCCQTIDSVEWSKRDFISLFLGLHERPGYSG